MDGARQADAPASEETFRAGHEVLEILGIGGQVPYAAFVDRGRRNAVEWFGPDPAAPSQLTVWRTVQELLVEENRAFELDWKWGSPEDLLTAELPALIPGFTCTIERVKLVDRRWQVRCLLMGVPIEGDVDCSLPHFFVDLINPVLQDRAGVGLEYYSTGADSHCFLMAPADRLEELHSDRYRGVFG